MTYIQIEGGRRLRGSLTVQGSKNAVLPMLSATLLHDGITVLEQVPDISDVRDTIQLLQHLGCQVEWSGNQVTVDASEVRSDILPQELVCRMRSSFLLAGALLGRRGRVETWFPGGCVIGARPVDLHLFGFRQMGVDCLLGPERICLQAHALQGNTIRLPYPSVGATENLLLTAVRAEGITYITGAALEPEVLALIDCLTGMGASIRREGDCLIVRGLGKTGRLKDSRFPVPGDRIVAGTLLAALAVCGGEIRLEQIAPSDLGPVPGLLEQIGMSLKPGENDILARADGRPKGGLNLVTGPHPGFPTDLQAIFMAMLAVGEGESQIRETVFESRFRHVEQLRRMGADIRIVGDTAWIRGRELTGSLVEAQDLRAGAALVVAGLAAKGITLISHGEYVFRGYENLPGILQQLQASCRVV